MGLSQSLHFAIPISEVEVKGVAPNIFISGADNHDVGGEGNEDGSDGGDGGIPVHENGAAGDLLVRCLSLSVMSHVISCVETRKKIGQVQFGTMLNPSGLRPEISPWFHEKSPFFHGTGRRYTGQGSI